MKGTLIKGHRCFKENEADASAHSGKETRQPRWPGEATGAAELGVGDRQWAMSWAMWAQVAQPQAGVTGAGLATYSWILGPKFPAGNWFAHRDGHTHMTVIRPSPGDVHPAKYIPCKTLSLAEVMSFLHLGEKRFL